MKHSKVRQSDLDLLPSAVIFEETEDEELENPEYEGVKTTLYGETGFGSLRQSMPPKQEVDTIEIWSVLDDIRFLETYPEHDRHYDNVLKSMRKKLCDALDISEVEYNRRFTEGDLPF